MQTQLLAKYPAEQFRVYAVWLPMLMGDAREKWNANTMPDPGVIHFWDEDVRVGEWFAREVDGYQGIAWDVYYLYGPEATWENIPEPLEGSGGTIYRAREDLKTKLLAFLNE